MSSTSDYLLFDPAENYAHHASSRGYPEHRVYVGDTCLLKSDFHKVGMVTQTHADLDGHGGIPLVELNLIRKHLNISDSAFRQYLRTGIPPPSTIVVTWPVTPRNQKTWGSELLPESEVESVDRELCIGDAVKRSPEDSLSGVVVRTDVRVNLHPPCRWPPVTSDEQTITPEPSEVVRDISVHELTHSLEVDVGKIVCYQGWIGRVVDYFETVKLRLSDGTIIELEDAEAVEKPESDPLADILVGNFLGTKKSNLRRGRATYGEYNPNVKPQGHVVEVIIQSIDVDWLTHKPIIDPTTSAPEMPSSSLERSELEDAVVYGINSRLPELCAPPGLDVCIGDRVRFKDSASLASSRKQALRWIPRQETLGYDFNVYMVAASSSTVQVQWQDNSISTHPSIALVPVMEFDDDDDVWPGELVTTRASRVADGARTPERVGIVQSVRSSDRIASVKWFEGTMSFVETEERSLMPGSWTGALLEQAEDVSLYDIWTEPGLPRRLGDFLAIIPPFGSEASSDGSWKQLPRYSAVKGCLESDSQDWFGEIIELGTNGLLSLYLGASQQPRSVQIPWECTFMAYSSDLADSDEDEDGDDGEESMEDDITHTVINGLRNTNSTEGEWVDEDGHGISNTLANDKEWSTDDEDHDEVMDSVTGAQSINDTKQSQTETAGFTYERMLEHLRQDSSDHLDVERFAILDGETPLDHHFAANARRDLDGPLLRRIQREHKILRSSLPPGVFVRTWESRLQLLRVLMLGPLGTPYEYAPFVVDVLLDERFPSQPPQTYFHSWTDGSGPVNPNLYEDGKICLSLLGTWPGSDQSDTWSPKATLLQVLVSLLGLVLVQDPYYNEAGFEVRAGSRETKVPSAVYAERSFLKSRQLISRAVSPPVSGFARELHTLYLAQSAGMPMLIARAVFDAMIVIKHAEGQDSDSRPPLDVTSAGRGRVLSAGAVAPLKRTVDGLLSLLQESTETTIVVDRLRALWKAPHTAHPISFEEVMQPNTKP